MLQHGTQSVVSGFAALPCLDSVIDATLADWLQVRLPDDCRFVGAVAVTIELRFVEDHHELPN
jgi:hypothetical protein